MIFRTTFIFNALAFLYFLFFKFLQFKLNAPLSLLKPIERHHTVLSRSLSNLRTWWTHKNKMHNMS